MSADSPAPFPLFMLTPRLVLRQFTLDDLEAAHALYSDPEVMRFSSSEPSTSLEATRAILEAHLASYAEHNFGKWAVAVRTTGEFIGYCGVALATIDGPESEPELGFRLLPRFQGQGYATEAGKVALDHCFSFLRLPRVLGVVEPGNQPSVRVLLKLGMTYQRQTLWHGKTTDVYAADRPPE